MTGPPTPTPDASDGAIRVLTSDGGLAAAADPAGTRSTAARLTTFPVAALVTLYLLATGRWGSYATVPGASFYIGDIALAVAALQVGLSLVQRGASPVRMLSRSPLLLLLVTALIGYAILRLAVTMPDLSLLALRDAAPYLYAVIALLAYLLPARGLRFWRAAVYGVFIFHLLWVVALRQLPGYPWQLPVLGTDAQIFVRRPDFDATVLGLGAAFALRDLLTDRAALRPISRVSLALMASVSTIGMLAISTRAGLLAGLAPIAVVVLARMRGRSVRARGLLTGGRRSLIVVLLGGMVLVAAMALTPAGSRFVEGFGSGAATGTISARQEVWAHIGEYVLRSPERTAVGVGFGRDFIIESGSAAALEGEYQNVRSPHNYVVGTLARLGVAGALAVSIIIGLGWWLAWLALRDRLEPATTLAALVAISIPIVSLLGVVLESPFGAIPYFWALGQLAAHAASYPTELEATAPAEPQASKGT